MEQPVYRIRRNSDDAAAIEFILRLLICLFVSLVLLYHLSNLANCVPRMDILILGQNLIFWLVLPSLLCEGFRRVLGPKGGMIICGLCLLWTIVMCVSMVISVFTRGGGCWTFARGWTDLIAEYSVMMFLLAGCGTYKFWQQGYFRFNRLFLDSDMVLEDLAQLKDGRVEAESLIQSQKNLDEFALLDKEKVILEEQCVLVSEDDIQKAKGTECSVCLAELDQESQIFQYPHCGHYFHKECIMKWLEGHSRCPNCRAGVRSGLYRHIERNRKLKENNPNSDRIAHETAEMPHSEYPSFSNTAPIQDPLLVQS